jgi:hydroxymethylglutaryl-CoA lyase
MTKGIREKVRIVEVGPRDGLQNEQVNLDIPTRLELIKKLSDAGLNRIEIGAFVSPKWVPQMAGSLALAKDVLKLQQAGKLPSQSRFSCLVPNPKGMEDAMAAGLHEVAIFGACSETFSKKNINCSVAESFIRFREVTEMAKAKNIKVRGYLSTAFGCPYEGKVSESRVVRLVRAMFKLGVYEVSLGDTIGVATPRQVESVLKKVKRVAPLKNVAMHFHDTRGTALANVLISYQMGIRTFDSSLGGLGGCPYAEGAAGNLATEDLVYFLNGMGIKTQADLERLIAVSRWIEPKIGHSLPSKVVKADLPKKPTW